MSKYDNMPIGQIQDIQIQGEQVTKRLAKRLVEEIYAESIYYSLDFEYCLEQTKNKMKKELKE